MIDHRYLPSAREELNEAAAFYEAAVPGLGEALLDDVERAIETLCEAPRIGAPLGRTFRKVLLRRFPYASSMCTVTKRSSSSQSLINVGARVTGGGDNDR